MLNNGLCIAMLVWRMHGSVRNKDVKVVGQMSEHFEFGSDIFNLGRTLFVWISISHMCNVNPR